MAHVQIAFLGGIGAANFRVVLSVIRVTFELYMLLLCGKERRNYENFQRSGFFFCIEVTSLRATHQLAVPLFVPPFALPALDRWLVPFV